MKIIIVVLVPLLAFVVSATRLSASPLDDKIAALKDAMKTEIADKEGQSAGSGAPENMMGRSLGALEIMLSGLDNPEQAMQAESSLQQILASFTSDAVLKAGKDLLDEIHSEQQAKVDAYVSSVDDAVKPVPDILLKAPKASDLDQLLVDLQKVQESGRQNYSADQAMQRATQRAQSVYQYVASWQDYLSDRDNGKIEQAQNELRNLAQSNAEILVPRSDILDLANKLTPSPTTNGRTAPQSSGEMAKQIASSIQSLDDMAPALQKIKALPQTRDDYDLYRVTQGLEGFVNNYDNTKAGMPVAFNFGGPSFQPQFNNPKLFAELWIFFFEHEFDAYKGPTPVEGESPLQFLESVFADAEQRQDWHELQEAYLAHAYLERSSLFSTGSSPHNTEGFELMLAGLNQETAGQYPAAVLSYEQALKFPDTYLPAKFIGDRLNNIQKDHPDDYAKGLQLAGLAPSSSAPVTPH
jgi:hypothetical protein